MPVDMGCIALIEDDPIMGESLQRALELEGWRTSWWQTGKDAIEGLQNSDPDLVLCDIRLPDMSGERGGILFLDEIAAMPLALQSKMLRVLEDRSFHRVGGETCIPLKARVVCAATEKL